MQAKANGEVEKKRERRERGKKRGEWEGVMRTEDLCTTKEREEDEEEDSRVVSNSEAWQEG